MTLEVLCRFLGTFDKKNRSFYPSLIGLLAWLFRLCTEPRRMHWCLLVWWCDT